MLILIYRTEYKLNSINFLAKNFVKVTHLFKLFVVLKVLVNSIPCDEVVF